MIELIVVRHGQSVADIEKRYEGRADFPLTDLGREHAKKLAYWLKENYPPKYIFSSPLKRTSETAEIVGREVDVEVKYDDDLMELDTGLLAGLLKSEADIKFPKPEGGHKAHEPILGGESLISFRARAETFWSKLISTFGDESELNRILVVSHEGMINMLFRCFMNLPFSDDIMIHSADTCVHLWRVSKTGKNIGFLNRTEHLL